MEQSLVSMEQTSVSMEHSSYPIEKSSNSMEHSLVSMKHSSDSMENISNSKEQKSDSMEQTLLKDNKSGINVYSDDETRDNKLSSIFDDTFLCKTDLCQCNSASSCFDEIRSTSLYCSMEDPELYFSMLSDLEVYDNQSSVKRSGGISWNFERIPIETFQDCVCASKSVNAAYKSKKTRSRIVTISDDLGESQVIPPPQDFSPSKDFHNSTDTLSSKDFTELEQNLMYFTPDEVVVHNKPKDIWVSYLGNVYDLTHLIAKHKGIREIKPLLAFAGKDISNWFNKNGELRHYIHPNTGVQVPYLPYGPIPDVRPHVPTTDWRPMCECSIEENDEQGKSFKPWWRSTKYFIGKLTKCARPIRIVNMLTLDECTLNVCSEDKLSRILERLLLFNSHASSYTFKYDSRVLDMDKTLDENHIFDERETFVANYLPEDTYIPAIHLYFNDDLQWDLDSSDECEDLE